MGAGCVPGPCSHGMDYTMPVTALDLALDATRPVTISFDGDATLTLFYKPTAYTGEVERAFTMANASGREIAAHAYLLSQLITSWDMEYAEGETVADAALVPVGDTSVTITHGLGFKPKPSQVSLDLRGRALEVKGHLKKVTDETFDVVLDEPAERATVVFWEVSGLGGHAAAPTERYLAKLPFPVLERIAAEVLRDLFPTRRTWRRS